MKSILDKPNFELISGSIQIMDQLKNANDRDVKKVAKNLESFFLYLLLKEMKKTVSFSKKSFMENTYLDIMYEKVSEHLSQRGTGIKDLILKYLRNGKTKEEAETADKKTKGVEIYEDR